MIRTFKDDEFIIAVKNSLSYSQIIEKLGLHISGGNYESVKKHIVRLNLDVSHLLGKGWNVGNFAKLKRKDIKNLSDILVQNSTYSNTPYLKVRLIQEGYFKHKCYRCNRTEWEGRKIPIELEHKNGTHTDNRIENLTILCPNCHALTLTYCGKNIKIKRVKHKKCKKSITQKNRAERYKQQKIEKEKNWRLFFKDITKLDKNKINEAKIKFNCSLYTVRYMFKKLCIKNPI